MAGFLAALKADDSICGQVINLGSHFEISIAETAAMIIELMNSSIGIAQDKLRLRPENSEVERLFSSNEKAKNLLNWSPSFAGKEGMRLGLKKTIDWFSRSENRSLYKGDIYNI